jgi:hypothetical protein
MAYEEMLHNFFGFLGASSLVIHRGSIRLENSAAADKTARTILDLDSIAY